MPGHNQLGRHTFAHVVLGDAMRTNVDDLSTAPTGQVGIEHTHILLEFLLGVATERLPALDKHSIGMLMVKTHDRESSVSKRCDLMQKRWYSVTLNIFHNSSNIPDTLVLSNARTTLKSGCLSTQKGKKRVLLRCTVH
jgi:hypothetical protein